jgi:hypothetical protein
MRGVKLLVWVISPTRMTRRSPVFAEKVQVSASPAGAMVPVWVQPLVSVPCARAALGHSGSRNKKRRRRAAA